MKISRALIVILLSLNLFKCTYLPPSRSTTDRSPAIRIGIAEKLESLTFETDAAINIFDQHDKMIGNQIQGTNWKVILIDAQPVDLLYRFLHQQVNREEEAQQIVANLDAKGISARREFQPELNR